MKKDDKTEATETEALSEPPVNVDEAPTSVEELRQQAEKGKEHWDRLLRTTADFDNYKKRAAREKQEAIKFANEGLIEKLMPILDSFERALGAAQASDGDTARALQQGVDIVFEQLKRVLKEAGLEEVDATGAVFDPNMHEAISARETTEIPEGNVFQQVRKGYKLRERLLRPASVIVAKAPETPPSS